MVTTDFFQKLTRNLELYLWKHKQFALPASGYDLILLMPASSDSWSEKLTLLLSAEALFDQSRWDTTYDILQLLRTALSSSEYLSIFNVDIIEPKAAIVDKVKHYLKGRTDGDVDAPISLIGGVTNQSITAIKSTIPDKLALNEWYTVHTHQQNSFRGQLLRIHPAVSASDVTLEFATSQSVIRCSYTSIETLAKAGVPR